MTRVRIYSAALVAFTSAITMMLVAIAEPRWLVYSVTTPQGHTFEKHIGLARSCSSLEGWDCRPYPYKELCQEGGERYFCSLWRSVSFVASFAVIACLVNLVTFGIIMSGGRGKRETGWPVVSFMLGMVAVLEFIVISVVAYVFDHDNQFAMPGWRLDASWYLGTVSAVVCSLAGAGLAASAYLLPPEDGYEVLREHV